MSAVSDTAAGLLLDVMFGRVSNPFPATLYVALSSTLPTNTGTNVTEPSGGSYARVAVTNNVTNWPTSAARAKSNGNAIQFPQATADWGDVEYFAIYGASSGGTFYGWGALDALISVLTDDVVIFDAGDLTITAPGA